EAAQGEARRLAELREKEAADALRSREAALAKLRALSKDRREEADRDAARLAALRAQRARETELANLKPPRARIIHPFDYKPRDHHNLRSILEWEGYQKELEALQEPLKVEFPTDLPK
ncbi:MAG: chromosome partitioning protein ParA, partial [Cephaloticoccus sp.]|nr:chromosome partitioning protein ParA [Cephaloticoccus sp.]